jgi:predicted acetyltransferase
MWRNLLREATNRDNPAGDVAPFEFFDPGPLVDGELELIAPDPRWVDDVLVACRHPLTIRDAPKEAATTREALTQFLRAAPGGHERGDTRVGWVPSYHFWMRLHGPRAPVPIAGGIGLRVGDTPDIRTFTGHVGYHVYPPARGHHYAERACRLLLPLARRHGMRDVWITCNPENVASRRTCERLGARLVEIVPIPPEHPFHSKGERAKCRYLLELKPE